MYGTVAEFLRRMSVSQPSAAQSTAAQDCLNASTYEVDSYLGRTNLGTAVPPAFGTADLALVTQVTYDRASEHWRLTPYGNMAQGPDLGPVFTARDSFERHRVNLQPLKTDWGVG